MAQQQNANLKKHADAMNGLLREMQAALTQLSKDQQALFNAVNAAIAKDLPGTSTIKTGLDAVHKQLKVLDGKVKDHAEAAARFAKEGHAELQKKKKPVGPQKQPVGPRPRP